MTPSEIADVAAAAGFSGDALVTAVAVALAESGGRPDAIGDRNRPHTGCTSRGLWQINTCPGRDANDPIRRGRTPDALADPATNAAAAFAISRRGTSWQPWTTYRTGAYRTHLPAARAAIDGGAGVHGRSRPPVQALPPIISPGLPGQVPALGAVADTAAPWAALAGKLVSWDTWRRVLYVLVGLVLFAAGVALIARTTTTTAALGGITDDDGTDEPLSAGDVATLVA